MAEKRRLDQLLLERGLVPSREIAQSLIMRGDVLVDDRPVTKPGVKLPESVPLRLRGALPKYVGRGGEKLEPALDHFQIVLRDRVALDVGASTGGFTDCMLQRGAAKVYATDVGHNQLALKLRNDPRVVVHEGVHARELCSLAFDPPPTFATLDLSFISVRKVLADVLAVLAPHSELVVLVKPQFELGPEFIEKGGVVRSVSHQREAVRLVEEAAATLGLHARGSVPSALTGAKKGNQEYFVYLSTQTAQS